MGKLRNRTRPTATFEARLAEQAQKFREMANQLPDGSKARDVLGDDISHKQMASFSRTATDQGTRKSAC